MKCYKCGEEVEMGLHICPFGNPVYYGFEPQKLDSILDCPGTCIVCGYRCKLRETAVSPDASTPLCPECKGEWRAGSTTERIQ